jgi:carbamoyltransferase
VGLVDGAMEFGPRALGNRSILADPRRADVQRTLNLAIKKRESFRPFAPAVLEEEAGAWFDLADPSPYMLLVAPVRGFEGIDEPWGDAVAPGDALDPGAALARVRSPIPAVTHVDGSARVQTVGPGSRTALRGVLEAFHRRTGCPVLVNTSFNVRGEPIVASPHDAYRCFMTTDMDWLAVGERLYAKADQPPWTGGEAPTVDD